MKTTAITLAALAGVLVVAFFAIAVAAIWSGEGRFWGLAILAVVAAVVVGIVAAVFAGFADTKTKFATIIGRDS